MEAENKLQNSNPIFRKNSVLGNIKNEGIAPGLFVLEHVAKEKKGEEKVAVLG